MTEQSTAPETLKTDCLLSAVSSCPRAHARHRQEHLASQLLSVSRLCARKKVAHLLHITLSVLPVGHMTSTEGYPSDLRDRLEPWIHTEVGDLVVLAVDEQRLNLNIVCLPPALPALDRTNYDELCRPLTVGGPALGNACVSIEVSRAGQTHMVR